MCGKNMQKNLTLIINNSNQSAFPFTSKEMKYHFNSKFHTNYLNF